MWVAVLPAFPYRRRRRKLPQCRSQRAAQYGGGVASCLLAAPAGYRWDPCTAKAVAVLDATVDAESCCGRPMRRGTRLRLPPSNGESCCQATAKAVANRKDLSLLQPTAQAVAGGHAERCNPKDYLCSRMGPTGKRCSTLENMHPQRHTRSIHHAVENIDHTVLKIHSPPSHKDAVLSYKEQTHFQADAHITLEAQCREDTVSSIHTEPQGVHGQSRRDIYLSLIHI